MLFSQNFQDEFTSFLQEFCGFLEAPSKENESIDNCIELSAFLDMLMYYKVQLNRIIDKSGEDLDIFGNDTPEYENIEAYDKLKLAFDCFENYFLNDNIFNKESEIVEFDPYEDMEVIYTICKNTLKQLTESGINSAVSFFLFSLALSGEDVVRVFHLYLNDLIDVMLDDDDEEYFDDEEDED